MKPCPDQQKLIAWLALDSLDARSAQELRAHLETCPGCRHYFAEMSRLAGQIASAAPAEPLAASDAFHRQLMVKINAEATTPVWATILDSLRTIIFNWRVARPVAAVLVALLVAGILVAIESRLRSPVRVHPPAQVVLAPVTVAAVNPAPTIANYQQVASQSLEKLDDLLARQGEQTGGSPQPYTASSMSLRF
jgi:anti-sigma factor RsiW